MKSKDIVLQAFLKIRQGKSAEQIICDEDLNMHFISQCRIEAPNWTDEMCNTKLLNLRKAGRLVNYPTISKKRPFVDAKQYSNCIGQAIRLMERQFKTNVDQIICKPEWRYQFDAITQFLLPGASVFESRYMALNLRKTRRLLPEPVGQIITPIDSRIIPLNALENRAKEIPNTPGVYIFFDELSTLYVGKADDLRRRVIEHVSTWVFRELVSAINSGKRKIAWVAFHALKLGISSGELAAYEHELIRSRQPEHNRAGKT